MLVAYIRIFVSKNITLNIQPKTDRMASMGVLSKHLKSKHDICLDVTTRVAVCPQKIP